MENSTSEESIIRARANSPFVGPLVRRARASRTHKSEAGTPCKSLLRVAGHPVVSMYSRERPLEYVKPSFLVRILAAVLALCRAFYTVAPTTRCGADEKQQYRPCQRLNRNRNRINHRIINRMNRIESNASTTPTTYSYCTT